MNYATQEKIRRNLYNGKIDVSHASNEERDLYKKIIQSNIVRLKKIIDQKYLFGLSLFWGIVWASFAFLSGYFYYGTIIYPYVIKLGQAEGFLYAIKFNIDFIVNHSGWAFLNAISLFMAFFFGFLAYKFFYTALYAKKYALSDLLRDEAMLVRLEK
jgi:hypothetical protein